MSKQGSYVVRGALLSCSCGSHTRLLELPRSHGVYIREKHKMSETDCVVDENITSFGICSSSENPNSRVEISDVTGIIGSVGGISLPIIGKECTPRAANKWLNTKKDTLVEGKPALLSTSIITCAYGGVISILKDGQEVPE